MIGFFRLRLEASPCQKRLALIHLPQDGHFTDTETVAQTSGRSQWEQTNRTIFVGGAFVSTFFN